MGFDRVTCGGDEGNRTVFIRLHTSYRHHLLSLLRQYYMYWFFYILTITYILSLKQRANLRSFFALLEHLVIDFHQGFIIPSIRQPLFRVSLFTATDCLSVFSFHTGG